MESLNVIMTMMVISRIYEQKESGRVLFAASFFLIVHFETSYPGLYPKCEESIEKHPGDIL